MNRFFLACRRWPALLGLLVFAFSGDLSAQCGVSVSNPSLTLQLNAGGTITLNEASAAPAVAPVGVGCYLVFSNDPSFSTSFTSKTYGCGDVGTYTIYVRAEDGNPGNTSPAPYFALSVSVVDNSPPVFSTCPSPATPVNTDNVPNLCQHTLPSNIVAVVTDNAPACLSIAWTITENGSTNPYTSGTGNTIPGGTIIKEGINILKYTATDGGGNSANCSFIIEVIDNRLPQAIQPICNTHFTRTVPANANCVYVGPADLNFLATQVSDNCTSDADLLASLEWRRISPAPATSFTPGSVVGYIFPKGNTTIRYRITDNAGNSRTCNFVVTVIDQTPPAFTIQTTRTSTLDPGHCDSFVGLTVTSSNVSDNCSAFNQITLEMAITYPPNPYGYVNQLRQPYDASKLIYFPQGTSVVTIWATDADGNESDVNITIVVTDDEPPIFNNVPVFGQNGCGSVININNTTGTCGAVYSWHRPNFFSSDIFECNAPLIIAVTETISNPQVAQAVPFYDPFTGYYTNPIFQSNVVNPAALFPVGETTITYTTQDNNFPLPNNTGTCTFKVVVKDVNAPNLVCPPQQTFTSICPTGQLPDYRGLVQVSDNCPTSVALVQNPAGGTTIGSILAPQQPVPGSTFTVTITGTDSGNNSNSCTFTVVLNDNGDVPVPTQIPLPAIVDSCGQRLVPAPTATFPCNPNSPILYGSTTGPVVPGSNPPIYIFNPGSYNVTWVYNLGNANSSIQTQSITVLPDTFPPVALCKPFFQTALSPAGTFTLTPAHINNGSYDPTTCNSPLNFQILGKTNYTCADLNDTTTVTLRVTDNKGNFATCQTKVDVFDNTPPVFSGLPNTPVDVESCSPLPPVANVTATDACTSIKSLSFKQDTVLINSFPVACRKYSYDVLRTWVATDQFNNAVTFTQTIRVRDTKAPQFVNVPNNLIIPTSPNALFCEENVQFNVRQFVGDCATGTDLTVSPNNGLINATYAVGTHTVMFTATDACGNFSTHVHQFTVKDATPPVPFCFNAISTSVNLAGTVTVPVTAVNNGSYDNCGIASMTLTPNTFDCDDADGKTKHLVVLTVTDLSGNTAACVSEVVVHDYVAPIIQNCPANVTVACGSDTTTTALGNVVASDNCLNTLKITHTNSPITFGPGFGIFIRTFKVTDGQGNTATCSQTIRLTDNVAPTLSQMPANVTVACPTNVPPMPVITATDNCHAFPNLQTVVSSTRVNNVKACGHYTYTIHRTWTATDIYQNVRVHTQVITVKDTLRPVFSLPDTLVFFSANAPANLNCTVPVDFNLNDYLTDCAADTNLTVTVVGAPFNHKNNLSGNYAVGSYKIKVTATDPCGNTAQDSIVLIVRDNSIPQAGCFDNVKISIGSQGTAQLMVNQINNGSTDNCSIDAMHLSQTQFDCSNIGTNSVTLFVKDIYGNIGSCTVDIQVEATPGVGFSLSTSTTSTSYFGLHDGTATVVVTGGSGNFIYNWSNGSGTATITQLPAGHYSVTVIDAITHCKNLATVFVPEGPKITFSAGTAAGATNTMVLVPITAQQFNNLISFQYTIGLTNGAVAEVVDVTDIHPQLNLPNIFDFEYNVGLNNVGIVWVSPFGNPLTLPQNTLLFNVKVLLKGPVNTLSNVIFTNTPVDIDVFQSLNGIPQQVTMVDFIGGQVQINSGTPTVQLGGIIQTWNFPNNPNSLKKPVANVSVQLTGTQSANLLTASNGLYQFSVNSGITTTVTCSKSTPGNSDNQLTSGDLLILINSVFGNPMPSPYQWVAADVNQDGKITITDYSIIQQLVLKKIQHFPNNVPDWKFIPESYVFGTPPITPLNPIPYPQAITHDPILQNFLSDNFVAVRMGDLNASTTVNASHSDDRTAQKLIFHLDDRELTTGEFIAVPVRAKDFEARQAYQFTLAFDPHLLSLEDVVVGALPGLSEDNFGYNFLSDGFLTTAWAYPHAVTLPDGEVLFTLNFRVLSGKKPLSKVLRPGSDIILAEATDASGRVQSVDFEYILPTSGGQQHTFELFPNQPNPFNESTLVHFRMPDDGAATLRITNTAGQLVKTLDGNFVKGMNTVRIHRDELGASGVYHLDVSTPSARAQIKMVLID